MPTYEASSPWASTLVVNNEYLDILRIRPVPAENDDIVYTLETQYTYRPDLLAYDLYGDRRLWWVFSQRNMDLIKDPVYDMLPGLQIYLPKGESLSRILGL